MAQTRICLQCGGLGLIPGLGRSPEGGHSNAFQYPCLENPHGQRSPVGYHSWGCKESDMIGQLSISFVTCWCSIKEEYSQLFEEALKILLPCPVTICVRPSLLYFNQILCHNSLTSLLFSRFSLFKSDIEEICKMQKQWHLSHYFLFLKIYFP